MEQIPAIKLTNLSKYFGSTQAVQNLNLTVNKGEMYALIGPNGAGKTTTIKMITGILFPNEGTVEILGVNAELEPEKAKQELGYIPDEPYIYDYLTGREFLYFVADLFHLKRVEAKERIKELLPIFQLETLIDGMFADYSRGNKQKTVIIANLMHQPKVLVIDEPIVGLDVQSQNVTKTILKDFCNDGGSILLCTHTLQVAQEIANRIGVITQGKLIEEGTLAQLQKRAKKHNASLEELYLKLTT